MLDLAKYSTKSCVVSACNLPILLDNQLDGEGMKFPPSLTGISSPLEARYEGKSPGDVDLCFRCEIVDSVQLPHRGNSY
jgi:hypothetical protein